MFRAFQVTGSNIARSRILSTTPRHTCLASRAFYVDSGESPAHDKLRAIFLEYKKANFPQEMPSRVFKMVLKATDENDDGLISVEEVENLLSRIGASDQMSKEDIQTVMSDLGLEAGGVGVPVENVKDFMMPKNKK